MKIDEMVHNNRQKFAAIKKCNLPLGQYAITSSGVLGIRYLREIRDIDIIVSAQLWDILGALYSVTDEKGVKKIIFPDGVVEAFGEGSFYSDKYDPNAPTLADRIAQAEIIEGLPFESLEHVLYYKRIMGREKDLQDIALIEKAQKEKTDKILGNAYQIIFNKT